MKEHYLGHLGAVECCPIRMPLQHVMFCAIWCHLCNFEKREKHPWRSVIFCKVAGLKLVKGKYSFRMHYIEESHEASNECRLTM